MKTLSRPPSGSSWIRKQFMTLMLATGVGLLAPQLQAADDGPEIIGASWVYRAEGSYENVRADLIDAIKGRGLVVSYESHLASMLRRTSDATGATVQVYDNATSLLFCKSDLTYELTLKNPHNITLCPYSIAVYTLTMEPGVVFLSFRDPPLDAPDYGPIHQLLEDIVEDVLAWH
jgi:uncharacterized protein (DUF302 family)